MKQNQPVPADFATLADLRQRLIEQHFQEGLRRFPSPSSADKKSTADYSRN